MKALMLLLLVSSTLVQASDKGGNGGGIHFCPGLKTQEMYDLYEGRIRYRLNIPNTNLDVDTYIKQALEKIAKVGPVFAKYVSLNIKYLKDGHLHVTPRIELVDTQDANIIVKGRGCDYKQLANWDDQNESVLVSAEKFKLLSAQSKAALYLHEAIYKVARDYFGDQDSDMTRRTVAESLSSSTTFAYVSEWESYLPKVELLSSMKVKGDDLVSVKNNSVEYLYYSGLEVFPFEEVAQPQTVTLLVRFPGLQAKLESVARLEKEIKTHVNHAYALKSEKKIMDALKVIQPKEDELITIKKYLSMFNGKLQDRGEMIVNVTMGEPKKVQILSNQSSQVQSEDLSYEVELMSLYDSSMKKSHRLLGSLDSSSTEMNFKFRYFIRN